jgi:hypothetical protein
MIYRKIISDKILLYAFLVVTRGRWVYERGGSLNGPQKNPKYLLDPKSTIDSSSSNFSGNLIIKTTINNIL